MFVALPIQLGTLQATQELIVVSELITPGILGVDFLSANRICLDMGKGTIESPELGKIFSEKTSSISAVRGVDIEKDSKSESDYYCRLHSSSTSSGDCDECHIAMFGNDIISGEIETFNIGI